MALKLLPKVAMRRLFTTACLAWCMIMCTSCEENTTDATWNESISAPKLAISPGSSKLGLGETFAVLAASGGQRPYTWSVTDKTLGSVPPGDSPVVTYSRESTTDGANIVRVIDANRWMAEAMILQTSQTNAP